MRVTTWTEYSLIIVLHLARRRTGGGSAVAARELAEVERLPGDYVEQILLRLRRAGLVGSVRGARGGYFLARGPEMISVRDVMTASEHQACSIRPVWQALQQRVDDLLSSISLADLMKQETEVHELVTIQSAG